MTNLKSNSKLKKDTFFVKYLNGSNPELEAYLQALGLGFCRDIENDSKAKSASLKNNRLRRLGFVVFCFASLVLFYEFYKMIAGDNNLANMIVSVLCSVVGFFLMESASRSTRMLEPLYLTKALSERFDTLSKKSSRVFQYKKSIKDSGRAVRVFHVSQANKIYMEQLEKEETENGGQAAI